MGGRAGFDVARAVGMCRCQASGPHNVIPGNLGEGVERIGALKD